jgi:hypothetical protein
MLETLNGMYGEGMKGKCMFVNLLVKSVIDYALMSEGIIKGLNGF